MTRRRSGTGLRLPLDAIQGLVDLLHHPRKPALTDTPITALAETIDAHVRWNA